jgi:hypothetical protein
LRGFDRIAHERDIAAPIRLDQVLTASGDDSARLLLVELGATRRRRIELVGVTLEHGAQNDARRAVQRRGFVPAGTDGRAENGESVRVEHLLHGREMRADLLRERAHGLE